MARGDHVKVDRGLYYHHGIDTGHGTVIHYHGGVVEFIGELGRMLDIDAPIKPAVRETGWEDFLKGGEQEVVSYPPSAREFIATLLPDFDPTAGKITKIAYPKVRNRSAGEIMKILLRKVMREMVRITSNQIIIRRISKAYRVRDPDEVCSIAQRHVGERRYHVITNNCEHFARYCKTGVRLSHQVIMAINKLLTIPDYLLAEEK